MSLVPDSSAPRFSNPAFRPSRSPAERRRERPESNPAAHGRTTRGVFSLPSLGGASVLRPPGSALLPFRAAFPTDFPRLVPPPSFARHRQHPPFHPRLVPPRIRPRPTPRLRPESPAPARIPGSGPNPRLRPESPPKSPPKPRRSAPRNVRRQAQRPLNTSGAHKKAAFALPGRKARPFSDSCPSLPFPVCKNLRFRATLLWIDYKNLFDFPRNFGCPIEHIFR